MSGPLRGIVFWHTLYLRKKVFTQVYTFGVFVIYLFTNSVITHFVWFRRLGSRENVKKLQVNILRVFTQVNTP